MMISNPQVFKTGVLRSTIARIKKEQQTDGSRSPARMRSNKASVPTTADPTKLSGEQEEHHRNVTIKVLTLHQFIKAAMEKVEHQIATEGNKRRRPKTDFDRGYLIRSHANLSTSTQGLHLSHLRNKKMTGGIFELIKLKRQIDLLHKQNTEAHSKNDSLAEQSGQDHHRDTSEPLLITDLMA